MKLDKHFYVTANRKHMSGVKRYLDQVTASITCPGKQLCQISSVDLQDIRIIKNRING
jgi:hypothetical protein